MGQKLSHTKQSDCLRSPSPGGTQDDREDIPIRFTASMLSGSLSNDAIDSKVREFYSAYEWGQLEGYKRAFILHRARQFRDANKHHSGASDASDVAINMDEPNPWAIIDSKGREEWPTALRKTRYTEEEASAWREAVNHAFHDKGATRLWSERFYARKFKVGTICRQCSDAGKLCQWRGRAASCASCSRRGGSQPRCTNLELYYVDYASRYLSIGLADAQARLKVLGGPGKAPRLFPQRGNTENPVDTLNLEDQGAGQEVPRKRGRPRKHTGPPNLRGQNKQQQATPQKTRPGNHADGLNLESEKAEQEPPRRRGRPRKHPHPLHTAKAISSASAPSGKTTPLSSIRQARLAASSALHNKARRMPTTTRATSSFSPSESSSASEMASGSRHRFSSEASLSEESDGINSIGPSSGPRRLAVDPCSNHGPPFSPCVQPISKRLCGASLEARSCGPHECSVAPNVSISTNVGKSHPLGVEQHPVDEKYPTSERPGVVHSGTGLSNVTATAAQVTVDPKVKIEELKLKIEGLEVANRTLKRRYDGLRDMSNQLSRHANDDE